MIEADQIVTVNGLETPSPSLEGAIRYCKGSLYSCNGRAWTRHGSTTSQSASTVGPLEQAIYVSSVDKIFGVRGPWLYRCNATTGEVEASFRWNPDLCGRASVCELNGTLYVAGNSDTRWDNYGGNPKKYGDIVIGNVPPPPYSDFGEAINRDIFAVDLSFSASVGTGVYSKIGNHSESQRLSGFGSLISGNGKIHGASLEDGYRFSFDPANISTYAATAAFRDYESYPDMLWSDDHECLVYTSKYYHDVETTSDFLGNWYLQDGGLYHEGIGRFFFTLHAPVGITLVTVDGGTGDNVYCVANSGNLYKLPGNTFWSGSNDEVITRPHMLEGLRAVRLKWNSTDNRIYIPDLSNDQVIVYNPDNDTVVSTKIGFSNPFDMVFTPSKVFAVQDSAQGLKEVV